MKKTGIFLWIIVLVVVSILFSSNLLYQNLEIKANDAGAEYVEKLVYSPMTYLKTKQEIKLKLEYEQDRIDYMKDICNEYILDCVVADENNLSTIRYKEALQTKLYTYPRYAIVSDLLAIENYLDHGYAYNEEQLQLIDDYSYEYFKLATINFSEFDETSIKIYASDLAKLKKDIEVEIEKVEKTETLDSGEKIIEMVDIELTKLENYYTYLNQQTELDTPSVKKEYETCDVVETWYDHDAENEILAMVNKERVTPTRDDMKSVKKLIASSENEYKSDDWSMHLYESGELHHPTKSDYHKDEPSIYGENILSRFETNGNASAEVLYTQWYNSQSHYNNYMDGYYTSVDTSVLRIDMTCDGEYDLSYATQRFN